MVVPKPRKRKASWLAGPEAKNVIVFLSLVREILELLSKLPWN